MKVTLVLIERCQVGIRENVLWHDGTPVTVDLVITRLGSANSQIAAPMANRTTRKSTGSMRPTDPHDRRPRGDGRDPGGV